MKALVRSSFAVVIMAFTGCQTWNVAPETITRTNFESAPESETAIDQIGRAHV